MGVANATASGGGNWYSRTIDGFAGFGRTLWVCRVPALSAALGLFLFAWTPQTQDLFTELSGAITRGLAYWSGFYLLAFAAWILPVFVSARFAIESYRRLPNRQDALGELGPRAVPITLALLCALALLVGQIGALGNLHLTTDDRATILSMFISYVASLGAIAHEIASGDIFRRTIDIDVLSERQMITMPIITIAFVALAALLLVWLGRKSRPLPLFLAWGALLTAACLSIVVLDPIATTQLLNRALLIPFLLGAWVPLLTAIGHLSALLRLPLLLFLVLAVAGISLFQDKAHDVRRVEAQGPSLQIGIDDAVASWQRANNCAGASEQCPPPIIVVAAGGASRAAFFTTLVLGDIVDRTKDRAAYNDLKAQLFAISSVSGGSLGAAVFAAALRSGDNSQSPPCRPYAAIRDDLAADPRRWHLALNKDPKERFESYSERWRDCLEMISAGDFISPVFVGLAFTDLLQLRPQGDRAHILERAWEERFAAITGQDQLARPLSDFGPTAEQWRPILILNATSVETGRRILASSLAPVRCTGGVKRRIFEDAYDFYEMVGAKTSAAGTGDEACSCRGEMIQCAQAPIPDVRLSSAAAISARFPIISPPANIKNADGRLVDLAVDGGYFENYGAVTAFELTQLLIGHGLKPVILQITNAPEFGEPGCLYPDRPETAPAVADIGRSQLFDGLRAPIRGVVQTRDARGNHATISLCNLMRGQEASGATAERYASVRVYPAPKRTLGLKVAVPLETSAVAGAEPGVTRRGAIKQLSMSWWLSKTLQRYLDNQLPAASAGAALSEEAQQSSIRAAQESNAREIEKVLRALRRTP